MDLSEGVWNPHISFGRHLSITVNIFAELFNCTSVGRASDLIMVPAQIFQLSWLLGPGDLSLVGPTSVQLLEFCWPKRLVSSQRWILIYMLAVLIHWWVDVLHADRTTSMCICTTAAPRVRLLQRKTSLSSPVIINDCSKAMLLWWFILTVNARPLTICLWLTVQFI